MKSPFSKCVITGPEYTINKMKFGMDIEKVLEVPTTGLNARASQ